MKWLIAAALLSVVYGQSNVVRVDVDIAVIDKLEGYIAFPSAAATEQKATVAIYADCLQKCLDDATCVEFTFDPVPSGSTENCYWYDDTAVRSIDTNTDSSNNRYLSDTASALDCVVPGFFLLENFESISEVSGTNHIGLTEESCLATCRCNPFCVGCHWVESTGECMTFEDPGVSSTLTNFINYQQGSSYYINAFGTDCPEDCASSGFTLHKKKMASSSGTGVADCSGTTYSECYSGCAGTASCASFDWDGTTCTRFTDDSNLASSPSTYHYSKTCDCDAVVTNDQAQLEETCYTVVVEETMKCIGQTDNNEPGSAGFGECLNQARGQTYLTGDFDWNLRTHAGIRCFLSPGPACPVSGQPVAAASPNEDRSHFTLSSTTDNCKVGTATGPFLDSNGKCRVRWESPGFRSPWVSTSSSLPIRHDIPFGLPEAATDLADCESQCEAILHCLGTSYDDSTNLCFFAEPRYRGFVEAAPVPTDWTFVYYEYRALSDCP